MCASRCEMAFKCRLVPCSRNGLGTVRLDDGINVKCGSALSSHCGFELPAYPKEIMTVAGPTLVELAERSGRPRALLVRRIAICVVYLAFSAVTVLIAYGGGALTMMAGNAPAGLSFGYGAVTAMKMLSFGGYLVIVGTAGRSVVAVQWVLVGFATWFVAASNSAQLRRRAPSSSAVLLSKTL